MLTTVGILAFEMSEVSDRLNTTLTLLLTQVALKQVGASNIPHVNYLTWLDQYTLFSCAVLIAIYSYMAMYSEPDAIWSWIFGAIWMAGNTFFLGKSKAPSMHILAILVAICGASVLYYEGDGAALMRAVRTARATLLTVVSPVQLGMTGIAVGVVGTIVKNVVDNTNG